MGADVSEWAPAFALVLSFWPWLLGATIVLLAAGRIGRLLIFLLGLLVCVGIERMLDLGGPDSPGLVLPYVGLGLAIAAVLAECTTVAIKTARRHRKRTS